MYHRSDQKKYYKNVLAPLEMNTVKRKNRERIHRRRKRTLADICKALWERRFDGLYRIIKKTWKNEWIIIALIRCLWELKIDPQKLGALGTSVMTNSKFIWSLHKKP